MCGCQGSCDVFSWKRNGLWYPRVKPGAVHCYRIISIALCLLDFCLVQFYLQLLAYIYDTEDRRYCKIILLSSGVILIVAFSLLGNGTIQILYLIIGGLMKQYIMHIDEAKDMKIPESSVI